MTKKQVLKIIEANKDILTPENYKGILKNIDTFTDEEKEAVVDYLHMAREMLDANDRFMEAQNKLYKDTGDELKRIDKEIEKDTKKAIKMASADDEAKTSEEADRLISNL